MMYRVIIEVGYCEAFFDFETADLACSFATTALLHQSENEDNKRKKSIRLEIVNIEIKEEVESD